ncbi:MAG: hypothetical protein RIG61_09735 [Deltaproteobacteria bacterium]
MRNCVRVLLVISFLAAPLAGCNVIKGLFNPFVGKWKSGIFTLDMKSDNSFEFTIGSTVSVNLEGEYTYDENKLTLNFDGKSSVIFSYEFGEDKRELVLVPETDFDYFKTKLEFTKE